MNGIKNESGICNARLGKIRGIGGEFIFTHRNPKTNELYAENIPIKSKNSTVYGMWINSELVILV